MRHKIFLLLAMLLALTTQAWAAEGITCSASDVGKVLDSRKWLYELKQKIVETKDKGEAVWLTIK